MSDTPRVHQGRPISVDFDSTPGLYVATFDNYDGALDSNHPVGLGRTEDAAVADLIWRYVE